MFRVKFGYEDKEKYYYKEFDDYNEADKYHDYLIEKGIPITEMGKPSKPAPVHYDYIASRENIAFIIDLYNNNIKSKKNRRIKRIVYSVQ